MNNSVLNIQTLKKSIMLILLFCIAFCGDSDANSGANRFQDKNNGTVLDTKTGLIWHKNDFSLRSIMKDLKKENLTIKDVEQFVGNLRTAGSKDWRIPTPDEFTTIQYIKGSPEWIRNFSYSVGSYLSLPKQKNDGNIRTTTWSYSSDSNEIGIRPVRGSIKE
jgi:hypothetical protein